MKHLSTLFDRYKKNLVAPQASVEKKTAEIISEITPFSITAEQITYSVATKTLSLQIPSVLRSELERYKPLIIERLAADLGVKNCPKIMF